ncbi:DUF7282 domain-containing protein [Halosimplex salinum]|uniref:DUF7282 domain-containing protein n=1 Tax=Halosimplex salinum TaxID=1710538 RepID=UPI000F49967E|nr:hypothetical protein [Halosimplex salinum]
MVDRLPHPSRPVVALTLALLLAAPLAVATAGAHGNHVAVDSQVTSDGTVVVETVSSPTPGFVVLRADDGGRPGDPLGNEYVGRTPNQTFLADVPIRIDPSTWDEWAGNRTIWAVLHGDANGNEAFDYGADLAMTDINPAASTRFTVGKGDSTEARVLAAAFDPLPVTDGAVTLRRVDLPVAGHVAVRPVGQNETVGSRSLDAGTHRNVTVSLDESFLAEQERDFRVRVVAHRDDGDGTFGPDDPPITAGGDPVGTYLSVAPEEHSDGTDEPLINTPSATATPDASSGSATAIAEDPSASAPTEDSTREPTDDEPTALDTTVGSGPGFGGALAALGVLLVAAALVGRRGQ